VISYTHQPSFLSILADWFESRFNRETTDQEDFDLAEKMTGGMTGFARQTIPAVMVFPS
jgi:hypothetical protein